MELEIILLDHQNNYVKMSSNLTESFNILAINFSVLHDYFYGLIKFSDIP